MDSAVYKRERVSNERRKFGSAVYYYPAFIVLENDQQIPALFTENQLKVAIERARKNEEDLKRDDDSNIFSKLATFFFG